MSTVGLAQRAHEVVSVEGNPQWLEGARTESAET
jgi:hypothetical protein